MLHGFEFRISGHQDCGMIYSAGKRETISIRKGIFSLELGRLKNKNIRNRYDLKPKLINPAQQFNFLFIAKTSFSKIENFAKIYQ